MQLVTRVDVSDHYLFTVVGQSYALCKLLMNLLVLDVSTTSSSFRAQSSVCHPNTWLSDIDNMTEICNSEQNYVLYKNQLIHSLPDYSASFNREKFFRTSQSWWKK